MGAGARSSRRADDGNQMNRAGGGNRTHTPLAGPRILSPVRLPVPPPRRLVESIVYAVPFALAADLSLRFVPTTLHRSRSATARPPTAESPLHVVELQYDPRSVRSGAL